MNATFFIYLATGLADAIYKMHLKPFFIAPNARLLNELSYRAVEVSDISPLLFRNCRLLHRIGFLSLASCRLLHRIGFLSLASCRLLYRIGFLSLASLNG